MTAWTAIAALLIAFALDFAFGEPPTRWHPVAWMGKYLGAFGSMIAPPQASRRPDWRAFWAGAMAWYGGAMLLLVVALLVQQTAARFGDAASAVVLGVLLKPMLAWRMLRDEVAAVEAALVASLDAGRLRLGRLVSREVMALTEAEVRESAIETLAENLNDSVVAPVFWFAVFGLPGAVVYRFANTADAMWGYRGRRGGLYWEWAGKFAARADDVLSWIPARITALLIFLAAGGFSLVKLVREARRTPSPNSGWPMAAMALALGVRLSKPGVYVLNGEGAGPRADDIQRAIRTAGLSVLALLVLASLALIVGRPS
jgi:adenosylcobinamide-phosphate synthase